MHSLSFIGGTTQGSLMGIAVQSSQSLCLWRCWFRGMEERQLGECICSNVGYTTSQFSKHDYYQYMKGSAKHLGALLDPDLLPETLMSTTATTTRKHPHFFQLHQVRKLALCLQIFDMAKLIHTPVTSRLDYYNTSLVGMAVKIIQELQLVQKVAAHLLSGAG